MKNMYHCTGNFAGVQLSFLFRHADTLNYYGDALVPADSFGGIEVPEADVADWMRRWGISNTSYGEYVISCNYACDELMKHDRMSSGFYCHYCHAHR